MQSQRIKRGGDIQSMLPGVYSRLDSVLPKFKTLKAISTKSIATGALDWSIKQVSCAASTRQIRHRVIETVLNGSADAFFNFVAFFLQSSIL